MENLFSLPLRLVCFPGIPFQSLDAEAVGQEKKINTKVEGKSDLVSIYQY